MPQQHIMGREWVANVDGTWFRSAKDSTEVHVVRHRDGFLTSYCDFAQWFEFGPFAQQAAAEMVGDQIIRLVDSGMAAEITTLEGYRSPAMIEAELDAAASEAGEAELPTP